MRYLALLRRPGTWFLLLVTAATSVAAYSWITPSPSWRVRFDGQAMLVGHTADEKLLVVSERIGQGASTVYVRTLTGERQAPPAPTVQNTDDMTHSTLGHALAGDTENGLFVYVTKRGNEWLLVVRMRPTGEELGALPLPSLDNVERPNFGNDGRMILTAKNAARLPFPTLTPDGRHLLYFTSAPDSGRILHNWSVEARREINTLVIDSGKPVRISAVGNRSVFLGTSLLSLEPGAKPKQVPALPIKVYPLNWFLEPSEERLRVLVATTFPVNDPDHRPSLRYYELVPGAREPVLLWLSEFPLDETVQIEFGGRPVALLEERGKSHTVRHVRTGKATALPFPVWVAPTARHTGGLQFGTASSSVVAPSMVRPLHSVGSCVVNRDATMLLVTTRTPTVAWRIWEELPNWARSAWLQSVALSLGHRWKVKSIDVLTGNETDLVGCSLHEAKSTLSPTLSVNHAGDRFAVMELDTTSSLLSYWMLPVRRGLRDWTLIVLLTLTPAAIVFVLKRLRRLLTRRNLSKVDASPSS